MKRHLLLPASTLLLAACQTSLPAAPAVATNTLTYTCDDGRTVQASYPDTDTAELTFDEHTHRLHIAISASGARYIGDGWQWWSKGMHQAWLAPLQAGESYASADAMECHAP